MRGRFFRRIAIGIALFFAFVFVAGWLGATFGGGFHEGRRAGPWFLVFPILLIIGFVAFGRVVRRTARPIGEVMDAAARVAEGDYTARAKVQGPGDVRDLARAFNRMAERLQTNEEQRRNLLADVAHELRTPLSVIRGRVEGMADGLYEPGGDDLALIGAETTVMARLLDDLQLLSNAEAGALRLHRERLEPGELVETAEAAHRAEAAERGVALRTEVAPDMRTLDVDRVRIGEVLANLVSNALRHTPAGGTVTVGAARDEAGMAFRVTDTGEGIPADELAHVFDRFTRSPESRGSGLGLAIAKSLVQTHGGTISAESEPGRGTTIRFVLPAA
ncbi:MAG TPA: HAMP domain-containing sensor histidine kinase [Actinomycetota bacterium]|nr:HAMP domain-containing sensor histidine kinase [Actinomycetota bacterium]